MALTTREQVRQRRLLAVIDPNEGQLEELEYLAGKMSRQDHNALSASQPLYGPVRKDPYSTGLPAVLKKQAV